MTSGPVFVDTSIGELLYKRFGYKFDRTKKLHNDFWYIWAKSGLLDFVCLKLRKKYQIPILKAKSDFISGAISMGYKSVTLETYAYYDKWQDKEKFKKELESIIIQLRLHHGSYWSLFDKIFYKIPLGIREKWEGFDMEAELGLISPSDNSPMVGFTRGEITEIHKEIILYLKEKFKRVLTIDELEAVDSWCSRLERNVRIWKDKKLVCLVIEQMKHYKIPVEGFNDNHDWSEKVKMTSERCSAAINEKLPAKKFLNAVTFRKISQRLYEAFPILREYVTQG